VALVGMPLSHGTCRTEAPAPSGEKVHVSRVAGDLGTLGPSGMASHGRGLSSVPSCHATLAEIGWSATENDLSDARRPHLIDNHRSKASFQALL
jgi:hypothetical protein